MQIKRHYVRWQINRQAKIKLEGEADFADCRLMDISLKGMQVSLAQKLPKDKFLKLSIALSYEFSLDIEAWVAWHKIIDGHNLYGLYFDKISDSNKDKICQFMRVNHAQDLDKQLWQDKIQDKIEEKGGREMEDRRIFARFAVNFPVRFLNPKENKEGLAQTKNVSAKGIGLVANRELAPHTPLEMWLDIPDKGEPLYTRGEVVWSKMAEPNQYLAGVDLEKADLMGLSRILRVTAD